MRAEHLAALPFILQDDIYLLASDKKAIANAELAVPNESVATPEPETRQPEPVIPVSPVIVPLQTPVPSYNYQGDNKKRFLILTHYANEDFIAADHLVALQSIIKRKGLEISDVAILNIGKNVDTAFNALIAFFKPEKLLILGKAALPAGIAPLTLNQLRQLDNCVALFSFSFEEMMSSNDNKKAFWDQMKNL